MKVLDKNHIEREDKVESIIMETRILLKISHPFIVRAHFTFEDETYIYIAMDFEAGGDLQGLITRNIENYERRGGDGFAGFVCDLATARFYTAELIEALKFLHSRQIYHRDLKPASKSLFASRSVLAAECLLQSCYFHHDDSILVTNIVIVDVILTAAGHAKLCDFGSAYDATDELSLRLEKFVGTAEYLAPELLIAGMIF
jgi:serine/threonine protein kinase